MEQIKSTYTLRQLVLYFLKLGYSGFGGPVALIGYMHRDLVERRRWFSEGEYKEGLTLAQLAPGPLAAQLGIYLGYLRHGNMGGALAGLAFVLPSFVMVVALGIAYKVYNGLPWMSAVFYGIGPAVVGIISVSSYKLTTKAIGQFTLQSLRDKWLLWLFYTSSIVITCVLQSETFFMFIAAGLLYMFVKAPPEWAGKHTAHSILLLSTTGFWDYNSKTLGQLALFFAKAGAFVFGSGLAILPFLHDAVSKYHWIDERTFLDAVAVAMITPGPVVITVAFIGYLVAGFPGACVAAAATFLPCYFFTIIPAPYFKKHASHASVKAFVDGITSSVVGTLTGSVILIAISTLTQNHKVVIDIPAVVIAIVSVLALVYIKKIQEPYVIIASAILGLMLKYAGM